MTGSSSGEEEKIQLNYTTSRYRKCRNSSGFQLFMNKNIFSNIKLLYGDNDIIFMLQEKSLPLMSQDDYIFHVFFTSVYCALSVLNKQRIADSTTQPSTHCTRFRAYKTALVQPVWRICVYKILTNGNEFVSIADKIYFLATY